MENKAGNKIEPDTEVNTQNIEKNRLNNESNAKIEFENKNEPEKAAELMQRPEIDSDRFFKLIDSSIKGLKEYRLIVSALELGVFESLKAPLSAVALAEKLGCDPVLMPHFCEALYSVGLLDRFEKNI